MLVIPANDNGIGKALAVIKRGGIVAHPTETCYGFACDLTNPDAVEKLALLKKRPKNQPVSSLFASIAEAKKWVEWNDKAEDLAKKYLPGPLTLILPAKKGAGKSDVIYRYIESFGSVGIRVSSHPVAMKLAERAGVPLSTTSANLHGQAEPYSAQEILVQFKGQELQPDLILDGGALQKVPPSTVISVFGGRVAVVRQGGIQVP